LKISLVLLNRWEEDDMKTMVGVLVCATTVAVAAWGQERVDPNLKPAPPLKMYQAFDVDHCGGGYVRCLASDNDGVVESAIREVLLIKLAQPSVRCDRIENALEELRIHGATPMIRLKASLAKYVYDNPAMFAEEGTRTYAWDTDVFGAIANRLRESVFVVSQ
jgi:hypothetical protein